MKKHNVKIDTIYLSDVVSGIKTFEIRKNDRDYKVGDRVVMSDGKYWVEVLIRYITDFKQTDGYVVFGFVHISGGNVYK